MLEAWIFHQKLTLSIDKLCSSNNQLINDWLEKLLMASDESNEDNSIVSDNLLSMQSFATCVINYIQDGSVIAVEFLKVFISIATKLLPSKNGVGFPELMVSSAGYLHTQQLCEESSAKHGPFYVTNIIEMNLPDLILGNIPTVLPSTSSTHSEDRARNMHVEDLALSIFYLNIEDHLLILLEGANSAREAWDLFLKFMGP
ncbi:hypothetical protein CHUAL_001650 [Chamberlinius hualienensis]